MKKIATMKLTDDLAVTVVQTVYDGNQDCECVAS